MATRYELTIEGWSRRAVFSRRLRAITVARKLARLHTNRFVRVAAGGSTVWAGQVVDLPALFQERGSTGLAADADLETTAAGPANTNANVSH